MIGGHWRGRESNVSECSEFVLHLSVMGQDKFDDDNFYFKQALAYVNQTNQPLFLTGKAGTGKTTFLKYLKANGFKKMAITAPTGVAAMNAGGTTLHALFWLPFGTFIEDYPVQWNQEDSHIYNKSRLFSTIKLTRQRRALLQEIELLVVDEVSMVRADTLDAIDVILKSVRRDMRPFGGVQILFIGDLYQLPPVVRDFEWQVLRDHYESPFFFDAKVLREFRPLIIELQKIYRQDDAGFIQILNHIRNNECTVEDIDQLNSYYQPDFRPAEDEPYITLSSHNRMADTINQERLNALPGTLRKVNAIVKDDFQKGAFPTEEMLPLKIGAQVMFIKNDSGEDRKYYNGKIGVVKEIDLVKDSVTVEFTDGSDEVTVKREIWENIKYDYNKGEDKIEEKVLGTFSQFPLRLAWAITIHKSQGLTFDRAVIDAGTSFAAGQVYVALSRLRRLDGLVLRSKITPMAIRTDAQVVRFMDNLPDEEFLKSHLLQSQKQYLGQFLLQSFKWNSLIEETDALLGALEKRNIDQKELAVVVLGDLLTELRQQEMVANKFVMQLHRMLTVKEQLDFSLIAQRARSAVDWFMPALERKIEAPMLKHIDEWKVKKRTKKYIGELQGLLLVYRRKIEQLKHALTVADALSSGTSISDDVLHVKKLTDASVKTKSDEVVSDTKAITLEMFQDGLSIEEIAAKRGMVAGTIYGHLIHFVGTEVEADELIEKEKLDQVVKFLKEHPGKSASQLIPLLGKGFDYPDIRIGQKVLGIV